MADRVLKADRPVEVLGALAGGCICGKRMLQHVNQGTCMWCGHGKVEAIIELAYRNNMEHNQAPVLMLDTHRRGRPLRWTEERCIEAFWRWSEHKGRHPNSSEWQLASDGVLRPNYVTIRKLFGGWKGFLQAISEVPREQVAA